MACGELNLHMRWQQVMKKDPVDARFVQEAIRRIRAGEAPGDCFPGGAPSMLSAYELAKKISEELGDNVNTSTLPLSLRPDAVQTVPAYAGPPCPFYGLTGMNSQAGPVFVESKGNACALACGHFPCRMETNGVQANWDECQHFNLPENAEMLEQFMEVTPVFVDAFAPSARDTWEGLPLSLWVNHVLGRDVL